MPQSVADNDQHADDCCRDCDPGRLGGPLADHDPREKCRQQGIECQDEDEVRGRCGKHRKGEENVGQAVKRADFQPVAVDDAAAIGSCAPVRGDCQRNEDQRQARCPDGERRPAFCAGEADHRNVERDHKPADKAEGNAPARVVLLHCQDFSPVRAPLFASRSSSDAPAAGTASCIPSCANPSPNNRDRHRAGPCAGRDRHDRGS